jgi:hypothetical protein
MKLRQAVIASGAKQSLSFCEIASSSATPRNGIPSLNLTAKPLKGEGKQG